MAAADIVVHAPPVPDPFPGVVLEAMASGRAVVASRTGGIPEQITDAVTGILVKPASVDELAHAILRLLGNPELRARLGAVAQQAYRSRFGRGQHAAAVSEIYRRVLAGERGKKYRVTITEMMRVALVSSDTSFQSGSARCLLRLALGLKDLGHEPVLLVTDTSAITQEAIQRGIEVHPTHARRPRLRRGWRGVLEWAVNFPGSTAALAGQLRRLHVGIVHANEFIELQAGLAARLACLPCIYHVRWPLGTSIVERCVARLVMVLSRGAVFVSRATRDLFLQAAGGTAGRPTWVIDDPGPEIAQAPADVRDDVRREFAFAADSLVVLNVSKLIPHKGQAIFLKAAAAVAPVIPEARFLVVGGEVPGHEAYARELGAAASQEPLRAKATLAGQRSDVPRLMAAADIVVHAPTIPESFPGVILEAMAAGRPIIASDIGGIPEQIENGITGVLVEANNVGALARAMLQLLGDAGLRARLGATAEDAYRLRFGAGQHARAVAEAYEQLLQASGRAG
jgi:glycosyltransferase involved in cell wall biosynthesis